MQLRRFLLLGFSLRLCEPAVRFAYCKGDTDNHQDEKNNTRPDIAEKRHQAVNDQP